MNYNHVIPVEVSITASTICVTMLNGETICNPLEIHQWLKEVYDTDPSLLEPVELTLFSVWWPKLDEGLDIEGMIQGIPSNPFTNESE